MNSNLPATQINNPSLLNKELLIQLTNNLYHLTLLFPKKEPLRYKMRELADEILVNFYKEQNPEISKNLEILDSFFELAKKQNWVSPSKISEIQEEYGKIRKELKKLDEVKFHRERIKEVAEISREKIFAQEGLGESFQRNFSVGIQKNTRQEKILDFLKKKGKVQIWEVKEIFPEVTKRTLRRDFKQLVKQGLIERIGEKNETFYQLPPNYESKPITNKGRTLS
ncbi:MAG: DeoR family transcriptional regulator [Patescibacteria group bacterium]|nr:DeoR family transcriptional regulator [Patescibacteria group bacterium]